MDINFINSSSTATTKIDVATGQVKATAPESTELERRATIQAVEKSEKEIETQSKTSQEEMEQLAGTYKPTLSATYS